MTFDEYQEKALITEAPIDDGVIERFTECRRYIVDMMVGAADYLWADNIKKYVFYGKSNDLLEYELRTYRPTCLARDEKTLLASPENIRRVHAWLGVASELPELGQAILSGDMVNLAEESGDFKYYGAVLDDAIGRSSSDIAKLNNNKLQKRYGDKFSAIAAVARDLTGERKVLEENGQNS